MFNNYKKELGLFAMAVFSIMMGCQQEEEPLDLELPGVTLEVSGNPAKLYNEVTLTSTATDNGTIERVVFYANSDSIGQVTADPYELTWNTKEVEDGPYVLKAVAHDASGNKSEAAKEVTIKNTLLVISVEDGYLKSREEVTQEQWVFLSDKKGHVVGEAKQVMNGESLRWERPSDFYSDTLYLSRLFYSNYEWTPRKHTYITVYTYTDFNVEEVFFSAYNSPDSVGKVDITVENDFDGMDSYLYKTRVPYYGRSSRTNGPVATYSVVMGESSQKGFSSYENYSNRDNQDLREKYYRFDDLEAGNAYTFHTNDYAAMEGRLISFPFATTYARVSTTGYLDQKGQGGYFLDYTSVWNSSGQSLKTFSVDDFPYIRTYISGSTESKYFYFSTMKEAPEVVSLPEFSVNVQATDMKNIEVTTNGTFDVGSGFWKYTEESDTEYLTARRSLYFSSNSGVSYVLPEIPASLLELHPSLNKPMEYSFSWASDNKARSSYEESLKHWFSEGYNTLDYREYSGLYTYPENAGGRRLPNHKPKFAQGQAEEEYLRERGMLSH